MSINLLDLAKGAISNQVMGQLSGILGESESKTSSAVSAALPALLGGLMNKASTKQGAQDLYKSMDDHDGGILDNLGGLLGGGNHSGLLNTGSNIMGMIFGKNQTSMLGTIGRMVGLGDSKIGTLLGLLSPVVMGILGKQRRSQNLDLNGFTNMMSSQKENLAGQIPGDLAKSMGLGDLLGSGADALNSAGNAVGDAGRAVSGAAGDAGRAVAGAAGDAGRATADAGKAGGNMLMSLLPLALLLGLAFLGWRMFTDGGTPTVEVPEVELPSVNVDTGLTTPDLGALNLNIPGFDAPKIGNAFGDLTKSISGIKDVASAQAVLPQLKDAGSMLEGLDLGAIAAGPQKDAVGGMFGGLIEKLKAALEVAYKVPGVQGVLEPAIGPLLSKFAAFGL